MKIGERFHSLFLAVLMVVSMLPGSALAAEDAAENLVAGDIVLPVEEEEISIEEETSVEEETPDVEETPGVEYLANKDIFFVAPVLNGAPNEQIIYNFLINTMGLNVAAAYGVLANIARESSFNPTASVVDTNGKTSYGICQWNGDRFTALKNYCNNNGYSYSSLEGQLKYLQYELANSEKAAWNNMALRSIANTSYGAYDAGYRWAKYFERCTQYYNGENQYEQRGILARDT